MISNVYKAFFQEMPDQAEKKKNSAKINIG